MEENRARNNDRRTVALNLKPKETIGSRQNRIKFWTETTDTLKKLKEMSLKRGIAKAAFQILI